MEIMDWLKLKIWQHQEAGGSRGSIFIEGKVGIIVT